jgi:hypothetical protein
MAGFGKDGSGPSSVLAAWSKPARRAFKAERVRLDERYS